MISSHVVNAVATFQWFITTGQADRYDPILYDNFVTTNGDPTKPFNNKTTGHPSMTMTIEDRQALTDQLSAAQRSVLLNQHPWLTAQLFHLQQQLFFDLILNGEDKPLGGEIVDFILRTEFQGRGTSHRHAIYALKRIQGMDLRYDPDNPASLDAFVKALDKGVTAMLEERRGLKHKDQFTEAAKRDNNRTHLNILQQETQPNYVPDPNTLFAQMGTKHPAQLRFDGNLNYDLLSGSNNDIASDTTQNLARDLSLAFQMHTCCRPCFKYCKKNADQVCRYRFPRETRSASAVTVERDNKSRIKAYVCPRCNNSYMNGHFASPLAHIGTSANHDAQVLINGCGGALEYITGYTTKAEAPDSNLVKTLLIRMLSNQAIRAGNMSLYKTKRSS
jgi:hypothetical protein